MNVLLSALDPPERTRLRHILNRDMTDNQRDESVRQAVERVEADLRALKDILGIYGEDGGHGGDDASCDTY